MNPDGVSYLDMASYASGGDFSKLVNGYWSPGYPALIGVAIRLFRPSASQEFPLIHAVNFVIFIFALWAFSGFLRHWVVAVHADDAVTGDEDRKMPLTPLAFCVFLFCTMKFIGMALVTPDLAAAAAVLLAAGAVCRLSLPGSGWKHYAGLGLALALGYYFKTAMFPLGFALLALLFVLSPRLTGVNRRGLLLSVAVFLLVTAPLLVALSVRANRPSYGETSRINYAWYVNGVGWDGGHDPAPVNTIPEHPAHKLLTRPMTLEFGSPVGGTYPLHYDPSYWYADTKARFDWHRQVAAMAETWLAYKELVAESVAFILGAVALGVLALLARSGATLPRGFWWQVGWPVAALSMYALVHVEGRYVGGFLVLLWLAIYSALMLRVPRRAAAAVCAVVLCAAMIPFVTEVALAGADIARDLAHPKAPQYRTVALGLRNLGLQADDPVAYVGYVYECYYFRTARLRLVAQVPNAGEFWRLSAPDMKSVAERLASIGVKAMVALNGPEAPGFGDWKVLKLSDTYHVDVLLLSPEAAGKNR